MCLVTNQKKAKILKEDLTVYKIVVNRNGKIYAWMYDDYQYEVNKLYKQSMSVDNIPGSVMDEWVYYAYNIKTKNWKNSKFKKYRNLNHIHEGFHSSLTIERLGNVNETAIYRCVIPKGSEVFKDKTGLIVSNQIILKEKICA